MSKLSSERKLRSLVTITIGGFGVFSGLCLARGNENFYKNFVMPVVHMLDPENSHKLAVFISKHRLLPKSKFHDPEELKINVFGQSISNPIGIAAGFDKDGKAILGLQDMGFGLIEIGSVTPLPQEGNDKPRVFRLSNDRAVINRYGFNNEGHEKVYERLEALKQDKNLKAVVGVNLGKNKTSPDAVDDYIQGIKKFGPIADYLVINVSSPNTPGLRNMQHKEALANLLRPVIKTRDLLPNKPPILLKLAPDLGIADKKDIAEVVLRNDCRVDGLIVCNTTVERDPSLSSGEITKEIGGLSGEPLKSVSTKMIADMSRLTNGMFIVGVGGVSSGADAYEKIKAGASLVQLYTSLVYDGPPVVTKVKKELAELLIADGYKNIAEAVGKDVRQ